MTATTTQIPNWNIKIDYGETCNCDFGCPCNFNGFPTYGFCRALVLYHIKSGNYGNIRLDGTNVIYVGSWPKAIHEGDGTMQLYISKNTTEEQRRALVDIFSGRAKRRWAICDICHDAQVCARAAVCRHCRKN